MMIYICKRCKQVFLEDVELVDHQKECKMEPKVVVIDDTSR